MSPDCATDVLQGATLGDDATILSEVGLEASRDCCPEQQSVLCRRGACHPWRWYRRSRRCHPWRCCHHGGVGFRRRVGFRGLLGLMPRRVVPVERTRGQEVPVEVPNRGAGGAERATSRAVGAGRAKTRAGGAGRTKSRGRWCRTSSSSRGGRSWRSVSGWRGVAWPSPNYGGEEADGSSVRIVVVFEEQRRWRPAWAQVARQWVAEGAGRANSRADDPGAAQIARREVAGGRWRRRRERRAVRLVSVPMTVRP